MADTNALKTLSVYHMADNAELYENTRSGFFTFIVEDIGRLVRSDFDLVEPEESDIITNGQDVIQIAVSSSSVPHFELEVREIRRGNSVMKSAGVPTFPNNTIVLDDFVGLRTKEVLMAWQALAYDVINDRGGRMHNWVDAEGIEHQGYKKNCTLVECDQNHEEVRHWDLIGCWVRSISEDNFDRTADGNRQITCEIVFDRAVMHEPD